MLTAKLLTAIETGEILQVRYFGGSTPGGERRLLPIAVADGKLRAKCLESNETKMFAIEKLEEVLEGVPSVMAASVAAAPATFPSIEEFVAHYVGAFENSGWVIQRNEHTVSLHRTFKRGKLIQTPDVALVFEPMTNDAIFDGKQVVEMNQRERSRPWVVRGKQQTTKTFAEIVKAQRCFLEFATQLAPRRVT